IRSLPRTCRMSSASMSIRPSMRWCCRSTKSRRIQTLDRTQPVLPLQERMEAVSDDADLEDVYNTERRLLYVACTRARDNLPVTGVKPASEFLDNRRHLLFADQPIKPLRQVLVKADPIRVRQAAAG